MKNENRLALQVAALKDGTVIDHIPSDKLFTVVSLLRLDRMDNNITIGYNLESKKTGKERDHQDRREIFLRRRDQPHFGSDSPCKTQYHTRLSGRGEEGSTSAR